jgi:hypothetical protein
MLACGKSTKSRRAFSKQFDFFRVLVQIVPLEHFVPWTSQVVARDAVGQRDRGRLE